MLNSNLLLSGMLVFWIGFFLCAGLMPLFIRYAQKHKIANSVKLYLPNTHRKKLHIPNMGGAVIISSILITTALFCDFSSIEYLVILTILIGFSFIGLYDDLAKMYSDTKKGISERQKIILQIFIASIACFVLRYCSLKYNTICYVPFFSYVVDLGYFYDVFCVLVICGASNAVNLTDGLDGLATLPICITAGAFAYLIALGNYCLANNTLIIVCLAVIGSGLGFLLYNIHPAKIFMGDIGSLPLGAVLGTISVITKNQFFLAIIGGVFVIEALSVITQVAYRKVYKGKRLFRMAPIHHHFEQLGIPEAKIVRGFWIASLLFAALGLSGRLFTIV